MILPSHPIIKWVFGPVGTAVLGATWWLMKKFIGVLKSEWSKVKDGLDRIEKIQTLQAENHLRTIETNTATAVQVLEKIHDSQLEMSGYMKAMHDKS